MPNDRHRPYACYSAYLFMPSKEPMAGAVLFGIAFRDYGQSPTNHILSGIYYDILRCSSIIHGYKQQFTILENNHIVNVALTGRATNVNHLLVRYVVVNIPCGGLN